MRYLAIDHGQKRIGLAVSDVGQSMAFPHSVLEAGPNLISKIIHIIQEEKIDSVVVGLPLNMDGSQGLQAKAVQAFARVLSSKISLPIIFFDERLSSAEADWKLAGLELSRGKKKKLQDAVAAASFLQVFLDEQKISEEHGDVISKAGLEIIRLETSRQVAQKALDIFSLSARRAIDERGVFFCALSGGASPKEFFTLAATETMLEWTKIHLFWADERCVGPEHPDSNFHLAETLFLSKSPIPRDNIHRIEAELHDPHQAAENYERTIRDVFSLSAGGMPEFDLVILGLGEDGHTALLLPGTDTVHVEDHLAVAVSSVTVSHSRITLTVPVLLAARKLMFLITGTQKARIVDTVLDESPDAQRWPVHSLWPAREKMVWLLDAEAASMLR
jgi:6-phosphogluconolactonase